MIWLTLWACTPASPPGSAPAPALVVMSRAERGALTDRFEVPGEVRALSGAELAASAEGQVERVTVREGARVQDGQLLLVVDAALSAALRDQAAAAAEEAGHALDVARRDLQRLEQVDPGVLAATELDAARSQVSEREARASALRAAAQAAAVELQRHRVTAPFSGVVSARLVDQGDWVQRGQHVLSLISADEVDVRVDVSPRLAAAIHEGDAVLIDGQPGRVAGIVPVLDPSARTALVRVVPETRGLTPGATVGVRFDVAVDDADAVLVPRDALVLGPVETRVVRVVDGKAEPRVVEVLASTGDAALVTGIDDGDTVVIRGNERLRPGQAVVDAE